MSISPFNFIEKLYPRGHIYQNTRELAKGLMLCAQKIKDLSMVVVERAARVVVYPPRCFVEHLLIPRLSAKVKRSLEGLIDSITPSQTTRAATKYLAPWAHKRDGIARATVTITESFADILTALCNPNVASTRHQLANTIGETQEEESRESSQAVQAAKAEYEEALAQALGYRSVNALKEEALRLTNDKIGQVIALKDVESGSFKKVINFFQHIVNTILSWISSYYIQQQLQAPLFFDTTPTEEIEFSESEETSPENQQYTEATDHISHVVQKYLERTSSFSSDLINHYLAIKFFMNAEWITGQFVDETSPEEEIQNNFKRIGSSILHIVLEEIKGGISERTWTPVAFISSKILSEANNIGDCAVDQIVNGINVKILLDRFHDNMSS